MQKNLPADADIVQYNRGSGNYVYFLADKYSGKVISFI
jgi:hypothetical protein